jgi:hypothetical protein
MKNNIRNSTNFTATLFKKRRKILAFIKLNVSTKRDRFGDVYDRFLFHIYTTVKKKLTTVINDKPRKRHDETLEGVDEGGSLRGC